MAAWSGIVAARPSAPWWQEACVRAALHPCVPCNGRYLSIGLFLAVLVWSAGGCKDNRITVGEMKQIEAHLAQRDPVAVDPAQLALTDMHPYRIRPGDVLAVRMVGLQQDRYAMTPLQVRVYADGKISLPVVGNVQVGGLELGAAEQAIIAAHVPSVVKDMSVYIELTGPEATTVFVTGAVNQPGILALRQNERNVIYAVALSGGFTPASSGRIKVTRIRPERGEIHLDLYDPNDLRRALLGPPLEPGDIVDVEAAEASVIYVTGVLNAPAPLMIPPRTELSLLRVLAASGGLTDFIGPNEATLRRRLANGDFVQVKLDLAKIQLGEAEDIALRAGDILEVPHTVDSRLRQWFAENIRVGPFGVTATYDPVADYRARILRNDRNDESVFRRTLLNTFGVGLSDLLVPLPVAPVAP